MRLTGRTVREAEGSHRTPRPQGRNQRRKPALCRGHHAARLLPATVVQPVRPGHGGGNLRHGLFRQFTGLDGGIGRLPSGSTILRFSHLLEQHDLNLRIMGAINATLAAKSQLLKAGTVVDATLIAAPSSAKNDSGERDPEMLQTKKGNQWHGGMKAHIGVDAQSGLVHTVNGTADNVNNVTQGHMPCCMEKSESCLPTLATTVLTNAKRPRVRPGRSPCIRESASSTSTRPGAIWSSKRKSSRPVCGPKWSIHSESSSVSSVALSQAEEKHGATRHPGCVVQYLDGKKQAAAQAASMSASVYAKGPRIGQRTTRCGQISQHLMLAFQQ